MKLFRRIFIVLALLAVGVPTFAQSLKWEAKATKARKGQYKLEITATIPQDYHLYDLGPYDEYGPVATSIVVEPVGDVQLVGELQAPAAKRYNDQMYGMEIGVYEGKAVFTQMLKVGKHGGVKVDVKGMVCSGFTCKPPVSMSFDLNIK